jgi:hypothetical protein
MTNTGGGTGAGSTQVTASTITGPLRLLDRHARTIVKHAIAQHGIRSGDLAEGVAEHHTHVSKVLHEIQLEHGSDAMNTAAEYAAAALEAGSLYPGEELDAFLRSTASAVRNTSRDLMKSTPFGG